MQNLITIFHLAVAVLMSICILLQHRASGLSATFGGAGFTNVVQRRGAEKLIYNLTIWLSVIFFGFTIARWYIV